MAAVTLSMVQPCSMVLVPGPLYLRSRRTSLSCHFCFLKCCQCCAGRRLRSVIVIQAQRGNWNRRIRYFLLVILSTCLAYMEINQSSWFFSRLSNFFFFSIPYRSKHKFSDNLLEQVDKYAATRLENQSKLISKVNSLFFYCYTNSCFSMHFKCLWFLTLLLRLLL